MAHPRPPPKRYTPRRTPSCFGAMTICAAEEQHDHNERWVNQRDRPCPLVLAMRSRLHSRSSVSTLARLQDRVPAGRTRTYQCQAACVRCRERPPCVAEPRPRPRHQPRSSVVTFATDDFGGWNTRRHGRSGTKSLANFRGRRSFGGPPDLSQQALRQRHSGQGGPRLQFTVQHVRHISDLDHFRHVISIVACVAHVHKRTAGSSRPKSDEGSSWRGDAAARGLRRNGGTTFADRHAS